MASQHLFIEFTTTAWALCGPWGMHQISLDDVPYWMVAGFDVELILEEV